VETNKEEMENDEPEHEELVYDVEEVVDEEIVAKPEGRYEIDEELVKVILNDAVKWIYLLLKLEKVLIEEMTVKKYIADVIEDELKEVRRELNKALWKLGWALSLIKDEEVALPEELINQALEAFRGPEPRGAERPWIVGELMRRYRIR